MSERVTKKNAIDTREFFSENGGALASELDCLYKITALKNILTAKEKTKQEKN